MNAVRTGLALIVATVAAATAYIVWAGPGSTASDGANGPACDRAHTVAGSMICLRTGVAPMSTRITVYSGPNRAERLTLTEWGIPSRARVSPSGNMVTWTVFRTGDSYLVPGTFATTAGIYNLATGAHYGSLEDFAVMLDGRPYTSPDVNFWGVTFADDTGFYATLGSRGRTWLVRGDLTTRTLTTLRGNVECPSLSPDGTRIAYKHRTGDRWRLHVLELATGRDIPLADPSHVDDQAAWLDNATVTYSRPDNDRPATFAVPADGTGAPHPLRSG